MSLPKSPFIRRAAVLGAGVMGAQIAAHLVNAGVQAVLFDLTTTTPAGADPAAIARRGIDGLRKLDPSPLAVASVADRIVGADYDHDLARLADCDLVIEAIAERTDWKHDLYRRIAPHLASHAILASNTSGLSIAELAQALPADVRPRFCGVHFFNPPRYMHLVELIPTPDSAPAMLDALETFLVTTLGKGVVRAKDTPNFIANRVGTMSILAAFHHTQRLGLGFDEVDAITGTRIGRPKSATYRTADVVGLDTLAHVVGTLERTLPDDPWHPIFRVPAWLQGLLDAKQLGQKTGGGIYRKVGRDIHVLDLASGKQRVADREADPAVVEILKLKDPAERLAALRASDRPQAQFLWACTRDTWHYCAVQLVHIADHARDVDLAIRWGFGWSQGPFEAWQAAGWQRVAGWIAEDIAAGRTLANVPLPAWVLDPGRSGVHTPAGSFAPTRPQTPAPRSTLPVYRRQRFPERVAGEDASFGSTVLETDAVRLWTPGDDVAVVSFKSKMHAIGEDVLDGIAESLERAERDFAGLVIWQTEPPFSVGANLAGPSAPKADRPKPSGLASMMKKVRRQAESAILKAAHKLNVADALMAGRLEKVEGVVAQFQQTSLMLRYASIPTVAAVDGMALGGGCEFAMHTARTVAALESYLGLVEVGVGLLPAGGGCKELALRAAQDAKGADLFPFVRRGFEAIATAQVSRSAAQARELGLLRPTDLVVMHRHELLHIAIGEVHAMVGQGWRPPLPAAAIPVAGRSAAATFKAHMTNLREGGFISAHDWTIGAKVAHVITGGDVDGGTTVDEQWLLDLEREAFMELIATPLTQARIDHMLKTGKPLRN